MAIFLLALILMASPVAGFRPILAARFRTWRMPRPVRRILAPFFRWRVVSVTKSPSTPHRRHADHPSSSAPDRIAHSTQADIRLPVLPLSQ